MDKLETGCYWLSSAVVDPEFDDMDGSEVLVPVEHRVDIGERMDRWQLAQRQFHNGLVDNLMQNKPTAWQTRRAREFFAGKII